MQGVHKDLVKVMTKAIVDAPFDFAITEGLRTKERQAELIAQKKSTTLNSRHITGDAVDVAIFIDGEVTWDYEKYAILAKHIKAVARYNRIPIKWGGDWKTFKDAVHFELHRGYYK
jgi:peptidoglycan L-alanyl-D-glutamate endopeptidase CwlK